MTDKEKLRAVIDRLYYKHFKTSDYWTTLEALQAHLATLDAAADASVSTAQREALEDFNREQELIKFAGHDGMKEKSIQTIRTLLRAHAGVVNE